MSLGTTDAILNIEGCSIRVDDTATRASTHQSCMARLKFAQMYPSNPLKLNCAIREAGMRQGLKHYPVDMVVNSSLDLPLFVILSITQKT